MDNLDKKLLSCFVSVAGVDHLSTLPKNFNVRALEPFAWELAPLPCGAILVELRPRRSYVLVLKHANGNSSLWQGDLPMLTDIARAAGAPRLWPVRRL